MTVRWSNFVGQELEAHAVLTKIEALVAAGQSIATSTRKTLATGFYTRTPKRENTPNPWKNSGC